MAIGILRFGLLIFAVGVLSFFFFHKFAIVSVLSGIGFTLFVVGFTAWSLESTGDINLG